MPFSPAAPDNALVLDNGLVLKVLHEPRLRKAAAFLRVEAGSHDVDPAWPGLAHFLEHLFFLGTERYDGDQALMAYVQRQGGQLNASTRERHTEFFFEVPPAALSGALERLCEMLARPRLALGDQRREREVLHAEFLAWSRDAEAQHQLWLSEPLSARHPLRAFHAGNRYSLPLGNADFQQGLLAFYRRFYHGAQMSLCLAGPQPVEGLLAVARRCAQVLPSGKRQPRPAPVPLLDGSGQASAAADPRRLNLVFACQALPEDSASALAFLTAWAAQPQPGGLLAELQKREWVERLDVRVLYHYADQAVLDFDFRLTPAGVRAAGNVAQLCLSWLEFFEALGTWTPLEEEYALLRKRQQLVAGALELARREACPASEPVTAALGAVLAQLKPENLLHPLPAPQGSVPQVAWRLPQRNRFLRPTRRPDQPLPDLRSVRYAQGSASAPEEGEVFVRWRGHASRHPGITQVLDHSLRRLADEARQAGVRLTFHRLGDDWQLRLSGIAEPMPALLEQAALQLANPPPETWRLGEPPEPAAQAPIRELLKRLPEHCLGFFNTQLRDTREAVQASTLAKLWGDTRWEALAVGFREPARSGLNQALRQLPGQPASQTGGSVLPMSGRRWSHLPGATGEHALLLFCPAPQGSLADEAAWRLLAHLAQTAFYQRMRVELQLGYAVFASFRQISGSAGLVFGVQSPGTALSGILGHMEQFFEQLPRLINNLGTSTVLSQAQSLATRLSRDELDTPQLGETLWQAGLGGKGPDYLEALQAALAALRPQHVAEAARRLQQASSGWLALANGPAPDDRWQAVR
ncbi:MULTISPECIES: pyrroloquinoline quinone biosynthesis protein PqqF [unclassified Pseudomonas]|uniref:pyrroloquinoline quinone biosynthesis protein PqqF n=1 Tax=unclassified Pseudomonas TaxID=196821 RepID=UPI000BDDD098|nr:MULTISPECIES: pyrroloquinoline quinone biosynthesis protein PqqF [unclassified Pseudomonas]PVZ15704.1 coenzyme PQQ biosynthesis probable peptidase PqqF [Pseudomonas sp. URIL14HWK12:I12]PVZ25078.1 coenzyme PQQ biosynthesis probable peptidase PqqF [Pseudomonas sp. URIL14HWK12:I10]PVZ34924.1 coenzyme PQQ biosynthesis probable peptidase PqqF [Pseudomonas sp. URIL14HWK12:I11]SNZ09679.1 coenzyme PQQ biosynthesis probable peptidase PqqF [Pseudomonas sp. URIL14HWK12:I9]